MSSKQASKESIRVTARNIGGIDESTVTLSPGVTILTGRNATNRTSFLQAIMAALGSERVSLKGDAEEGSVEMQIGDDVYTRKLNRRGGTIAFNGSPYLDDPELADLFSFLLESNESRRAVVLDDDLRELIMRPVDTEEIQAEIDRLQSERREVDQKLENIESQKNRLPTLEQRRDDLEAKLEEKEAELETIEAELEADDADVEETREEKAALDQALDELNDARSELKDVQYRLETERDSLESVREERAELENELEDLPKAAEDRLQDIEQQIASLREQKRQCDTTINKLQTLVQFNEDMLNGDDNLAALVDGGVESQESGGSLTDQLLADTDQVVCWTCGSEVGESRIESFLDRLKESAKRKRSERADIDSELNTLSSEKRDLESQRSRRTELDRRINRLESEVERREGNIESLETQSDELESEIGELESNVEELESDDYGDVLDRHKEANQVQFEIGRLTSDISDVRSQIDEIESRVTDADDLEARREEIQLELEDERTKIERLEREAVSEFNEHMGRVLDVLGYENLDRIWIERTEQSVREGRRKVDKSVFDLHVIRSNDSGATYEDTIDHLSESEREVTGLVFGLAGYLVHEVYRTVPFMLLDSLEAIDSERIAELVEYFEEFAPNIVVALLPEDAQALDGQYARVTEI